MDEVELDFEYDGVGYNIDEDRDENGVVIYSCKTYERNFPVFIRTNGVNVFHFKVGDGQEDDDEDLWSCCTSRYQLVHDFTECADERDETESIISTDSWHSSAIALLDYIRWL